MDWLFGCFGGAGKKARKHAASQKACQRPFHHLPEKVLPPSSISIKGCTPKEEVASNEDFLQERDFASLMPAKDAEGTIHEASQRTPDKLNTGDPWFQLDGLEEELEDLRKQIEQETIDAKKIKEEVTFLRSCGTLLQTPAELRKRDRTLESGRDGTPSKGWHSWLVPSVSPAVLCPADATRTMLHDMQSPIIEKKRNGDTFNSKASFFSKNGPMPHSIHHTQEEDDTHIAHPQNSSAALGRNTEDHLDFATGINKLKIPCSRDGDLEVPTPPAKQSCATPKNDYLKRMEGAVVASTRNNSVLTVVPCTGTVVSVHDDRFSSLKKGTVLTSTLPEKEANKIATTVSGEQLSPVDVHAPWIEETAHGKNAPNTISEVQETPRFSKHRYHRYESSDCASYTVPESRTTLKMTVSEICQSTSEMIESEICQSSSCYDHLLVLNKKHHKEEEGSEGRSGFVSDDSSFNTVMSSTMDSEKTLTDLSNAEETSANYASSQTPQSRPESVTSCKDQDSSSRLNGDETNSTSLYSLGSTQNSVAQADGSRVRAGRYDSTFCEPDSTSLYSLGSTQNSIAQTCRRKLQAGRYDSEFCESEADSCSRVSTECSHLVAGDQNEQIKFFKEENPNLIKTPNVMLQWQDTPDPVRPFGVRSRPASPVLTPVENACQWRELNKPDRSRDKVFESNDLNAAKWGTHHSDDMDAFTGESISDYTLDPKMEVGWDENQDPDLRGIGGCTLVRYDKCKGNQELEFTHNDMSLSNWLTTPQPMKGGNFDNSTTLPRHRYVANVEAEWSRKHVKDPRVEYQKSSCDASEPCAVRVDLSLSNWLQTPLKQDEAKGSTVTPAALMQRSPSRCIYERPILGLIVDDMNSSSVTRKVHWDGMGIPNTTTKYKEDQRVNWHASPFEARLERALNSQEKASAVERTPPLPNRLKSLQ